jgi:hypothetical protein
MPAPRRGRPPGPRTTKRQPQAAPLPAKFAGLTGDALYQALINDNEVVDEVWLAEQCLRKVATVDGWLSKRDAIDEWEENGRVGPQPPEDDRTTPAPLERVRIKRDGHWKTSHRWHAGPLRRWMIQVGLMTRAGVGEPYRPAGRTEGSRNTKPRADTAKARQESPLILAEFRALRDAGVKPNDAYTQLATKHGLSERMVRRRVENGRLMEREVDQEAVALLREYEAVRQADSSLSKERALARLGEQHGLTAAQVERTLNKARTMLAAASGG